eukprot:9478656-Pyramimonas_sp.AAC.1
MDAGLANTLFHQPTFAKDQWARPEEPLQKLRTSWSEVQRCACNLLEQELIQITSATHGKAPVSPMLEQPGLLLSRDCR